MNIWHLRHKDINKKRWDRTIKHSPNGQLYAWSWYLDAVTPGWEALVNQDYSAVMPLPARRKHGIHYLFQPLLTQQLGVFSLHPPDEVPVKDFLNRIPSKFRWIQITLNQSNSVSGNDFKIKSHVTCELDLSPSYHDIAAHYSTNTRRNIRKANEYHCTYESNIPVEEFLRLLHEDQSQGSRILLSRSHTETFNRLILSLTDHQAYTLPGIRDTSGTLIAASLIGVSHNRFYYLAPAQTNTGRKQRAMFYLLDRFIESQSESTGFFDFEGSDIENLARFYLGFGSRKKHYLSLQINRFPWPLNIFFLHLSGNL